MRQDASPPGLAAPDSSAGRLPPGPAKGQGRPPRYPVQELIDELHARFRSLNDGQLASYIPELATVDPGLFAIAVVTCDGFAYETGDSDHRFTIQSVSKPIVYGMALDDWGHDEVLRKIGVEPSGDPFNSITFDTDNNRPFNPMVNAGAIAASALIRGKGLDDRRRRMLAFFERFAGRPLDIDDRVYRSEAETGHRNRAIAYLELNAGMIDKPVDDHLDLYFQQCSLLVTARDLAVMAATLANSGINPATGVRALRSDHVRDVLSVMNSCGMYDYAGEWQFTVGLPAKSGVGGGIMAVLPGQLGIGVFSPLLDATGNSCRGVNVCKAMSQRFRLHLLAFRGSTRTIVRRRYRVSEVRSKRARRPAEATCLDRRGADIAVFELQGDLSFANLEKLTRSVVEEKPAPHWVILDAGRLVWIDSVAFEVIARLSSTLAEQGRVLVLAALPKMADGGNEAAWLAETGAVATATVDAALELCEDALLATEGLVAGDGPAGVPLGEVDILREMSPAELALLEPSLEYRLYAEGEAIVREGEAADRLFMLTAGRADVCVTVGGGAVHRVGTVEAGTTFGELVMFSGGKRTADVVAATETTCRVLSEPALAHLAEVQPRLYIRLMKLVGRNLADRLRRANAEIRALSR